MPRENEIFEEVPTMSESRSKVQQFIMWSIVPIVCSIVVGFIFFQESIFDRHNGVFQFLWSGVVASVFYYLLVFVRPRDTAVGFVVLLFLTFLTTESTRPALILRDIFYIGAIGVSVYLFFKHLRQDSPFHCAHSAFLLAGIYGIVYVIASEIHLGIVRSLLMEDTGGNPRLAFNTAFFGLLIGFAVGLGIALNEKFFGAKQPPPKQSTGPFA
jgi:hypothetical protein